MAIDPGYGHSYTGIAEIYLQWIRLKEALAFAQKGAELRPKRPWAHFILGLAYLRRGEYTTALACFEKAVALRGDFPQAHQMIEAVHRTMGEEKKAGGAEPDLTEEKGLPLFMPPGSGAAVTQHAQ